MTPERLRQIGELFEIARKWPAEQRRRRLARRCAGDLELYWWVQTLIECHEHLGGCHNPPIFEWLDKSPVTTFSEQPASLYRVSASLNAQLANRVFLAERVDGGYDRQVALLILDDGSGQAGLVRIVTDRAQPTGG
ncbi:hypothetical protein [Gloeobacter kilaueensis]|uniref:TPR repeat-containing serine/threonine protein kinase n=1 Tax=Gloeobacter kilaueensis (strain ATCC BAA-2537 / CCAP 1431/1 / ULC 316 / JS1) TaxID=1183438 RepID=U5QD40_GLOK1|nr:hypothetical protein [Gloeobacter kilaueensis]AGY56812.1 TPR repeat-containing serine/threonine protein kinase [Gloeobacter kilaueensis JS1]